ncbi:DUF2267 domain-containing protein [Sulfitobacter sp. JBTF-M27]|jgi:uncharacterized protein (DUF2267 family)|uniref:DUF2267 domain-containing protein n=1 Tax=Sulfitobacter sediminilitoris TaxID=2698830 RepID=A0A6P0CBP8_9RHOB|nr:DUF2267 domain-containing protein [Sulfitobacter sediminilitoris]NEK23629.1 DUF2267 domain-containing protein [Sulfitobacter sediminilitoris]
MSDQGLQVIDRAEQVAHEWVNELSERLDWSSKRSALRMMRVTLHNVRDHLLPDELAQLSAQLPLLIRGIFFEGWVPKRTPVRERSTAAFVAAIEEGLGKTPEYRGAEDIRYVFEMLNNRLSAGEIKDVRASLPEGIRSLWPAP